MAGSRWLWISWIMVLIVGFSVFAQDSDPDAVVGQTLSWNGSDAVLNYDVVIEDASGHEIFHQKTDQTQVNLQLKPGIYRYQIVAYNLLEQPEGTPAWEPFEVLRAEIPQPQGMLPGTLYLEDPVLRFTVRGSFLKEGALLSLARADAPNAVAIGVVTHRSDQEVMVEFPHFEFVYGDYALTVQNPGGLRHTLKAALKVRYEKPVDFHVVAGYAPVVPLYDEWFKQTWSQPVYPLSALARLEVLFLKRAQDSMGISLDVNYWSGSGGVPTAVIQTQTVSGGLSFVYQFLFSKHIRGVARIGGGLTAAQYAFDYGGIPGAKLGSLDPYAALGLGASYWFTKNWFLEGDLELVHGFDNGYASGLFRPSTVLGFSF